MATQRCTRYASKATAGCMPLLTNSVANVSEQGIFFGFAADAQIRTIGFRESRTFQAFTHTSLVIIDGWEVSEGGSTVLENLQGFTPPRHASVKL